METVVTVFLLFFFLPTLKHLLKGKIREEVNNVLKSTVDEILADLSDKGGGTTGGKKS